MYANKGDLNMEAVNKSAGMNHPSFSNGAAYGDLDNDGDYTFRLRRRNP